MSESKYRDWLVFIFLVFLSIIGTVILIEKGEPYLSGCGELGYLGVFLTAFLVNAMIILPAPFLVFALSLAVEVAVQTNFWAVVLVYAFGATLGEGFGYLLGLSGGKMIKKKESHRLFQKAKELLKKHGDLAVFGLSFQPILPFDFLGIMAGVMRYPWRRFLVFCFLGRIPKYALLIGLGFEILRFVFG